MVSNMAGTIRPATVDDIEGVTDVRVSVHENPATREGLNGAGITAESTAAYLTVYGRGWVAEEDGRIVGFSVADARDASIWPLFVRPEYEGRGYGGLLLNAAVDWLFLQGKELVWLETGRETRAFAFYLKRGWVNTGIERRGDTRLELARSGWR